ncbi:MAG: beta-galactosidase GalA [Verrucomicrobiia bacterium]
MNSKSSSSPVVHRCLVAVVFILLWFGNITLVQGRDRTLIDPGWRFQLGDPSDVTTNVTWYPEIADLAKVEPAQLLGTNSETYLQTIRVDPIATQAGQNVSFVQTNYNDSGWRLLNLPHDWVVELPFDQNADGSHGFKSAISGSTSTNTIAWYRRTFTIPSGYAGQTLWLDFDGVYRNSLVWLNGHILGRNVSGYASFYYDVTPYANPGGTNVLVVRVDASRFEGWFYEGAGIYRHVWLTDVNPVHVAHWGTYVATTLSGANATVTVQTTVTNQSSSATVNGSLTSTILDANSNAVTAVTSNLNLAPGQGLVVTQTLTVANAHLWSLQTPYLYNLASTVSNATAVADVYTTTFGARTVSFDSTNGFTLNGQRVEIFGVCNHQDAAGVGIAVPDRLLYYRLERMKQMGVNGYRTSHNMPAAELLDDCDRLGILVLDENRRLGTNAEPLNELTRLLLRDRNHPSILAWSLGNEEYYIQASQIAEDLYTPMQNLAHSLDSTRLCTIPINGSYGNPSFAMVEDVVGFNYDITDMAALQQSTPTDKFLGTEVASTLSTRGIYTNNSSADYCSSYDLELNSDQLAETWFPFFHARPWSSGGFIWTGFDYRGEPTPYWWPDINSHFGVMDTCGFSKDNYFYYQANWTVKPVLHIFPHWNWAGSEGQPISVWVYGNCDMVELFLNGISQGQQALLVTNHVAWNVPYAAGTLLAVGYRNGQAVVTNSVQTTGTPAAVALIPDRNTILADGCDVSVVKVAVLDAQGLVVPMATNEIYFSISGGAILGVGNGNPTSLEADKASSQRAVFNGLAEVIVQSTNQTGSIILTATATGLTSTNITITEAATLPAPAAPVSVVAIATNQQNVISWDVVPGALTYNVKRSTTSGGPYSVIATNIATIGFIDTNVVNLMTYYYVVTAVNANGESVNSIEVSGTPHLPPVPTVPTGVTATRSDTQVTLSWVGASGAASYNVKRGTTSGTYTTITNLTGTSLVVTGLVNGTMYYFVVSALNPTGESGNSTEVSVTPMAFVAGLTPSVVSSQVQLLWYAHAGATSYNVKRSLVSGGPYTTIATGLTTTNFTDTTVSTCQTYYYVVTMMIGGVESVPSPEISVTVPGVLPSPFTSADVGTVGIAGSATYCGGQFTLIGSGADIWNTADEFQFVYVYVPFSTNCDIRARVVSVQVTSGNAKAGVMIRETLAANSRHALVDMEPGSTEFITRTNTGAYANSVGAGGSPPYWVRLTRTNNTFTAYNSADGNTWNQFGTQVISNMAVGAYIGLIVCSHTDSALNTSVLDNVSLNYGSSNTNNLLINPGFELPGTGKIKTGFATVPGWANSGTTYSDTGVQPGGHSGSWEGYGQSSDDGAYQIVGNYQIQTGDQFTLTWWSQGEWNGTNSSYAGTNSSDPKQTVTLLRAAATNTAYASTVQLALQTNGMPGGVWTPYTLTYTAIAPDAGKYIGVSFVTSKNSGKTSGTWAGYDDFSLTVVSIPPAPTGLSASAGNGQVILNWNSVANASGYYIKRSLVSGGSYTTIYTNQTSTTFTNTGLANGTTYYYVVSAFNQAGASANSTEVSAKPTNMPPVISWVVPTNNSTFIQPKTITLTASATDADGTVTNVAFFNGTNLLGNVTSSVGNQYSLTWNNATVGSYTLSARATDNSGATNISPATINLVVQPLTLTLPGTQASGQFRLTFQGQNGQNYVLQTSTNLTAAWTPVWTSAPVNGMLSFTNLNATDRSRFYRVGQ